MASTRIEIQTSDGTAPAFVFGDAAAPGVLFFIDGIGMRPAMHAMAERLAAAGFHVLMPDLFWRLGPYTAPDPRTLFSDPATRGAWFGRVMSTTTADKLAKDASAYLDHFGGRRVGLTGYCMGGRMAIVTAETYPERVAAVAAYHPGGLVTDAADSPHLSVAKIKARVYVGAASDDPSFTDLQRAAFTDALAAGGVDHAVELYPAKHGWVPADTPAYDAAQAERHWETLVGLFKGALG
ncbi:MAG: dienelactone hydrolase family protein [Polyangiaceae bacterium]